MKGILHGKKALLWLLVIFGLVLFQACSGGIAALFISADDERDLGDSFYLLVKEGDPSVISSSEKLWTPSSHGDSLFADYFDSMASLIVDQIPDDDMESLLPDGISDRHKFFSFHIIKSETENAFAVPGGYVFFYSKIIESFNSEAELVGVLSHEVGHIVMHHSREAMLNSYSASALVDVLIGDDSGLGSALANLGLNFWLMDNSRDNELQSDSIGVIYAGKVGVAPTGVKTYFERGLEFDSEGNCTESTLENVIGAFSTHPPSCERVKQANSLIKTLPESERDQPDNASAYKAVLAKVTTF